MAAGATLTAAAEAAGIHRVTIYRWIKTIPDFTAAVQQACVESILARRDDLHHLSNRALETVLSVLDDSKASPSARLRAAMFVLQRPQLPKAGWALPEPLPEPNRDTLVNSALIEMQPKNEFSADATLPPPPALRAKTACDPAPCLPASKKRETAKQVCGTFR